MSCSSYCLVLLRFSRDSLATSEKLNRCGSSVSSTSRASASVSPEFFTAAANIGHSITELPHEDDEETQVETKSSRRGTRRGGVTNINSVRAVNDIVNMILAPMVIVPFFDYLEHGKIPRSNTAKPGTADGATAKMGSLNSISQPLTNGWTVIFVSVR